MNHQKPKCLTAYILFCVRICTGTLCGMCSLKPCTAVSSDTTTGLNSNLLSNSAVLTEVPTTLTENLNYSSSTYTIYLSVSTEGTGTKHPSEDLGTSKTKYNTPTSTVIEMLYFSLMALVLYKQLFLTCKCCDLFPGESGHLVPQFYISCWLVS
jgi:hypothetical protein